MARKAILEGGRRDEIIAAASELFFTEGYEGTSVRQVLKKVGGEIGMFYHYFSSKEELFDVCMDRFFRQYAQSFEKMAEEIGSADELIERFLPAYEQAMSRYYLVEKNMHWTIRSALHERTLRSLFPAAESLLKRFEYHGSYPLDIAAAKAVADVSAVIHSGSFAEMNEKEKREILLKVFGEILA